MAEQQNVSLFEAIRLAQDLTEADDPNGEYVRGQAELICDMFRLDTAVWSEEVAAEIRQEHGKWWVDTRPAAEPARGVKVTVRYHTSAHGGGETNHVTELHSTPARWYRQGGAIVDTITVEKTA